MNSASKRRNIENKATAITHQAIAKASCLAQLDIESQNSTFTDNELSIIVQMEQLAAKLPDEIMRKRTISFMQTLRDEVGYLEEGPSEGN